MLAGAILLAVSVAKLHGVAIKPGVSTPAAALAAVTADHVEGGAVLEPTVERMPFFAPQLVVDHPLSCINLPDGSSAGPSSTM